MKDPSQYCRDPIPTMNKPTPRANNLTIFYNAHLRSPRKILLLLQKWEREVLTLADPQVHIPPACMVAE
jgi:hypothetical protein